MMVLHFAMIMLLSIYMKIEEAVRGSSIESTIKSFAGVFQG